MTPPCLDRIKHSSPAHIIIFKGPSMNSNAPRRSKDCSESAVNHSSSFAVSFPNLA